MSDDNTTMPPRSPDEDRRDEGGSEAVSAAYRQTAREQPPSAIDAAVLAMAHREVNGIHVATPRPRWFVPVAVAATVVVAVSLGLQVSRTPPTSVATINEENAVLPAFGETEGAATDAVPSSGAKFKAEPDALASRAAAARERPPADVLEMAPPKAFAEPPAAAALPSPGEAARESSYQLSAPAADAADRTRLSTYAGQSMRIKAAGEFEELHDEADAAIAAGNWQVSGSAVRDALRRAQDEERGPEEWLQVIESLVDAGESHRARTEWLAFRAEYPDEPLPPGFPEIE